MKKRNLIVFVFFAVFFATHCFAQEIAHYTYNENIVCTVIQSEKDTLEKFNALIKSLSNSPKWKDLPDHYGIDETTVMIHVFSDAYAIDTMSSWAVLVSDQDLLTDDPPTFTRQLFRGHAYGMSLEEFLFYIEAIMDAFIPTHEEQSEERSKDAVPPQDLRINGRTT